MNQDEADLELDEFGTIVKALTREDAVVRELEVCILPRDDVNYRAFAIQVCYRSPGKWAVMHFSSCLGSDGKWDWEQRPSARDDEWLLKFRFPLPEALARAIEASKTVEVNGLTAERALARALKKKAGSGDSAGTGEAAPSNE